MSEYDTISLSEHNRIVDSLNLVKDSADTDRNTWRERAKKAEDKITAAKNIIVKAIEDDDINDELAKELAEALDIELTKTIEGTVTIEYSITLKVPFDTKVDDIDDSFFEADLRYDGEGNLDDWTCNETTLSLD